MAPSISTSVHGTPAGKERNWVKTLPQQGWFTFFRFYGPLQSFFDQTWKPDDIMKTYEEEQ